MPLESEHQQSPSRSAARWLIFSLLLLSTTLGVPQPITQLFAADDVALAAQETAEQDTAQADTDSAAADSATESGEGEPKEPAANAEQPEVNTDKSEEESAGESKTEEEPKEEREESEQPDVESKEAMSEEGEGAEETEEDHVHEVEEQPPAEEVTRKPEPKPEPKEEPPKTKKKHVIGATAKLMEKQSELIFSARVDSGAKSCSLHIEKYEIVDESEKMADNIGKVVKFQVKNGENKTHWLESKIAGYVIIKTSDNRERRYKVPITFRWKNMEKEILVTLNNRDHMEYPLLLGRNFLRGDFLVDVEIDSDD